MRKCKNANPIPASACRIKDEFKKPKIENNSWTHYSTNHPWIHCSTNHPWIHCSTKPHATPLRSEGAHYSPQPPKARRLWRRRGHRHARLRGRVGQDRMNVPVPSTTHPNEEQHNAAANIPFTVLRPRGDRTWGSDESTVGASALPPTRQCRQVGKSPSPSPPQPTAGAGEKTVSSLQHSLQHRKYRKRLVGAMGPVPWRKHSYWDNPAAGYATVRHNLDPYGTWRCRGGGRQRQTR